jgi:cell division protein ZapE
MTLLQRYQADLAQGGFYADSDQQHTVELLQSLYKSLQAAPVRRLPLWQKLLRRQPAAVKGVYLWGGPGRGKTYLMDCFFDSLVFEEKWRVHFHRFMLGVHQALDALQKTPDPLRFVAGQLAARYRVLCLDEFHVTDIADAMLLAGLLEELFRKGVVLVATSNTAPDDLYLDGLQRVRFVPAIELLKANMHVFGLSQGEDFRLQHLQHGGTYQLLGGEQAEYWLRSRMQELVALQPLQNTTLEIAGRSLQVRAVTEDIVWFEFEELCLRPRSARDYLELAREFHTLLLQGVPPLGEELDEAVRRFIHLIDALYDHGVKLIMTAAAAPDELYTGKQLQKPFQRTASRLTEMSGRAYLARPHRPD